VPVRGLLFDFDGLLLETEGPAFESWRWIYQQHGADLPLALWAQVIGTVGSPFDPAAHLADLVEGPLDVEAIQRLRWNRKLELLAGESLRPGVSEYLEGARAARLLTGIVTSDSNEWVAGHLERLAVDHRWDCIVCADGNALLAKPEPHLYREALRLLGLTPDEALVFEDSPNGIRAAKAAGLRCVAVPNAVTSCLDLSEADLIVSSLAEVSLPQLLERFGG
jgi:HAD superfamily hydrolase (TIGR01509 family)